MPLTRVTRAVAAAFVLFILVATPGFAQSLSNAIAAFAAGNYAGTIKGLNELADSGAPRARAIITALGNDNLYVSQDKKTLYIANDNDDLFLATTGAPAPKDLTVDDVNPVYVNNGIRNAITAALGTLNLHDRNPAHRLKAANDIFQQRDPSALPNVDAALKRETDPAVKQALEEARAAILITMPKATNAERLQAVKLIGGLDDQKAVALLNSLPADVSAAVKTAAAGEVKSIEHRLAMWAGVENLWYGISLGTVLLLAAVGLAISFGVMGVINMAHGELVMLGAYTTFVVQQIIRAYAPWLFDSSLFIAVPVAFVIAGAVGILIERTIIRFLYGRPLETLLATWGLSLVLRQVVRVIFGPDNRDVGTPSWMSGAFHVGGLSLTQNRVVIVVFALAVFVALLAMLRFTRLGLEMRAVTQNRRMAAAMGIKTTRVDALTFGLGSAVAGIAGVALSQIDNVSPNLGQHYIVDSFLVVVFGGVGNLWGTLLGALTLGVANNFLEPFIGAVMGKIVLLVLIILFIQRRPRGLFAVKGRAVEA